MRIRSKLILAAATLGMFATADAAQAQSYWFDCTCGHPLAPVYVSWAKEAHMPPIAPIPWYGSMPVTEQARLLAARAEVREMVRIGRLKFFDGVAAEFFEPRIRKDDRDHRFGDHPGRG